jgi:hypothetical protein
MSLVASNKDAEFVSKLSEIAEVDLCELWVCMEQQGYAVWL